MSDDGWLRGRIVRAIEDAHCEINYGNSLSIVERHEALRQCFDFRHDKQFARVLPQAEADLADATRREDEPCDSEQAEVEPSEGEMCDDRVVEHSWCHHERRFHRLQGCFNATAVTSRRPCSLPGGYDEGGATSTDNVCDGWEDSDNESEGDGRNGGEPPCEYWEPPPPRAAPSLSGRWGEADVAEVAGAISEAWTQVASWRSNVFWLPGGKSSKDFLREKARLYRACYQLYACSIRSQGNCDHGSCACRGLFTSPSRRTTLSAFLRV